MTKRCFDLNWRCVRPALKRWLPQTAHHAVRQIRSRFQPSFEQYAPIPLRLPSPAPPMMLPSDTLPTVSLVTPSLNCRQFLEQTISSVLHQDYPQLEYIIQDGGSTDDSREIVQRYRHRFFHAEICADGGQADAINRGFRHASGDIMAWLNADDLLLPGAIVQIVSYFQQHPHVDVVYGWRKTINADTAEIGSWLLPDGAEDVLPWANYIPQETLFWRRRIWEKTGGYLDDSFHFAMDWELLLRFYDAKAQFGRIPRFLGAFRVHPTQKTSQLEALGRQDAQRLHLRAHGRQIEWLDVRYAVRHYLFRAMCLYLRYYVGLLHE